MKIVVKHRGLKVYQPEIERIVHFAAQSVGLEMPGLPVVIDRQWSNYRFGAGCYTARFKFPAAYTSLAEGNCYLVRISLEGKLEGAYPVEDNDLPFPITLANWRETLVNLAAHEFYHVLEFERGLPADEYQANLAGFRTLEAYRILKEDIC